LLQWIESFLLIMLFTFFIKRAHSNTLLDTFESEIHYVVNIHALL